MRRDPHGRPCLDHLYAGEFPWFTSTINRKEFEDQNDPNSPITLVQTSKMQLHPVGRLDYDSTGLLLFSSSGPLTQTLLHPKHAIEKEYVATVTGRVDEAALRASLAAGVRTGVGVHTAQLVSAVPVPRAEVAPYLQQIRNELPKEYNTTDLSLRGYLDVLDATELTTLTLTVQEGKHRMVRRVLANSGHPVVSLHRRRLGEIELKDDDDLPPGQVRELTEEEMKWARRLLYVEAKEKRRAFLDQNKTEGDKKEPDEDDDLAEIRSIATGVDDTTELFDEDEHELREFKRRTLREAILEVYGNDDDNEDDEELVNELDDIQEAEEVGSGGVDNDDERKVFISNVDKEQNKRQQGDDRAKRETTS